MMPALPTHFPWLVHWPGTEVSVLDSLDTPAAPMFASVLIGFKILALMVIVGTFLLLALLRKAASGGKE